MNAYKAMKSKHQEEVNAFPIGFAFSKEQFDEMMVKRFGLRPNQTGMILSIGAGGYVRKADRDALHAMFDRHKQERQAAIDADTTGDGFIYDMFLYELRNHEFGYTMDSTDTLDALGYTRDMVEQNERFRHALEKAIATICKEEEDW